MRKLGVALVASACGASLACSTQAHLLGRAPGTVSGQVTLGDGLAAPAKPQPVIVYLEREGPFVPDRPTGSTTHVAQQQGGLTPSFVAIASGESVLFENADDVVHTVFSYSTPNDFDLGAYEPGEKRRVPLRYPGVVRLYCSMHPEQSGTIFVAPSRHLSLVSRSGEFELGDVQPGSYRIRTWSPQLPRAWQHITVSSGESVRADLQIERPETSR